MAALVVALELATPEPAAEAHPPFSRWKLAGRRPELEMEDLRALH